MNFTPNSFIRNKDKIRPLVRETVTSTLVFSDLIAMSLSFIFAFFSAILLHALFWGGNISALFYEFSDVDDLFFVWMCPIVLFLFFIKGHYTKRIPWWSQVQHVLSICLIAFIMDGFTRFALDMPFSRLLIGLSWVYVFFLTILGRQLVYLACRGKGIWRIPTTVIGDNRTVMDSLYAFSRDHYTGYDITTVSLRDHKDSEFNRTCIPPKYADMTIIEGEKDYPAYIRNNPNQFFVISLEAFRGEERDSIIKALDDSHALYAIIPPISRISLFEMEPCYFFGNDIMLLHAKQSIFSPLGQFLKRSMDITASAFALLLLSPLMIGVAIMLKVEGQGGSIFYGGTRIGKNGKEFRCWKFRSMEPDSDHLLHALLDSDPDAKKDWETYRKLKQADPRVTTKTASFIRKASIDELPQIWNVLVGDMSLVGPRPILDDERALFGESIDQYMQVRPGITGLWQVSGRNDTSFQRRVYYDSWYVRNWTLWGDIVILIKTLRVVLGRDGAY